MLNLEVIDFCMQRFTDSHWSGWLSIKALDYVCTLQREEEASQYSEIGTPTWSAIADEPMDYSQRGPFGDALPRQDASGAPRRVSARVNCLLSVTMPRLTISATSPLHVN